MGPLLFFLLPALASCRVDISVFEILLTEPDYQIWYQGGSSNVASYGEILTFQLDHEIIRKMIKDQHQGEPENIYFHSPTPWDDLYKRFGWTELTRDFVPAGFEVYELTIEKILLDVATFNDSQTTRDVLSSKRKNLNDSIKVQWYLGGSFDFKDDPIFYKVDPAFDFSINSTLGTNLHMVRDITIHSAGLHANVYLDEGHLGRETLTTTKVTLIVGITYLAYLKGVVAANYPYLHKGHHFYKYPIDVMQAKANRPMVVNSTQVIKFQFHTTGKIVVEDLVKETDILTFDAGITVSPFRPV